MAENETNDMPVTTEAPAETQAPETAPVESAPHVSTYDWREELNKVDPDELARHPRFAGILGDRLQRQKQQETVKIQEQARREAEEELLRLGDDNADYLSQHYPKAYERLVEMQKERAKQEVDGLRGQTRMELADRVGKAYQNVPEWTEFSEKDHEALFMALAGKDDDEAIPAFTQKAIDLVAEKRANKKMAEWRAKELAREREAIRAEERATFLQNDEAPDTTRPKGYPGNVNIKGMSDADFQKWYDDNVLNRR